MTGFGSPLSPPSPPQGNTGCEMIRSPSSLVGVATGRSHVSKCCKAIWRTFSEVYRLLRVHINRNPKDGEMGGGALLALGTCLSLPSFSSDLNVAPIMWAMPSGTAALAKHGNVANDSWVPGRQGRDAELNFLVIDRQLCCENFPRGENHCNS